jgi:hypothetical protein
MQGQAAMAAIALSNHQARSAVPSLLSMSTAMDVDSQKPPRFQVRKVRLVGVGLQKVLK